MTCPVLKTDNENPFVLAANASAAIREVHRKWHKANEMVKYYMLASMSSVLKHQHSAMATTSVIMRISLLHIIEQLSLKPFGRRAHL